MMKNHLMILWLMLFFSPVVSFGQAGEDSKLFHDLFIMDSLLFEEGFNHCDLTVLKDIIHPGLTFYHDQGGIQDRDQFFEAVDKNLCSTPDKKPIRKLVTGSLSVYPLYENGTLYGAIQKGNHEFYIREPGKAMYKTSIAKFTHLWLKENEQWLLKTVLSYDHQQPDEADK